MTKGRDRWLKQATRHLSSDSTLQVRTEIEEHYELAREAALERGATAEAAEQEALTALGDAKGANRQYRRVLLTSAEARLLRQGTWESRAVCLHRLARTLLPCLPVAALLAGAVLFRAGTAVAARVLLLAGMGMSQLFIVPFLPIYTPARSRVVRCVKWVVLAAMPLLAFGPDAVTFSWLLIAVLWPVAWVEWTRISIRRKLPVARWPKHLYL